MKLDNERVDDITIGEEAMEQEVRPKLEIGHIVPDFNLRTVDDKQISVTDYKEKKNLVILFFDLHNSGDWSILAELKRRYHEFTDTNAEVLAISTGPFEEMADCASSMDLPFPVLCDCDRETACAYCVSGAMVFVADKFGELKMQSAISEENVDTLLDSALSTLELIELECPECGVTSWPEF